MDKARPWGDLIQKAQGNFWQHCGFWGGWGACASSALLTQPMLTHGWGHPNNPNPPQLGTEVTNPFKEIWLLSRDATLKASLWLQWVQTSVSGEAQAVNTQDFGLSFVKMSYLAAVQETELHLFIVSAQNSLGDTEIPQFHLKTHVFRPHLQTSWNSSGFCFVF